MLLQEIHHANIYFTLSPEEARLLARACDYLSSNMPGIEQEKDALLLSALGAAFEAAGLAGVMQRELTPGAAALAVGGEA